METDGTEHQDDLDDHDLRNGNGGRLPGRYWRTPIIAVVAIVAAVAALWLIGNANPVRPQQISDDVAGPFAGEPVDHYLARTRNSLDAATGRRWALVSLKEPVSTGRAWAVITSSGTTELSAVALHVQVPGVQTPTSVIPASSQAGLEAAPASAAWRIAADAGPPSNPPTRTDEIAGLAASRLRAGGDVVIGFVVHADASTLRGYGTQQEVRAVDVLPAEAAGGLFAVVPLLPEQTVTVQPLPDTGTVPPA